MEENNPLNIYDTFALIVKSYGYKRKLPWESDECNMPFILTLSVLRKTSKRHAALCKKILKENDVEVTHRYSLFGYVAKQGYASLLEEMNAEPSSFDAQQAFFSSCRYGRIDCVKICIARGYTFKEPPIKTALSSGSLETVKYLHKCGFEAEDATCSAAVEGGLEMLKYAHERGLPWDEIVVTTAITSRRYDCMVYAVENGCPISCMDAMIAANIGVEYLKYIIEHGGELCETVVENALQNGRLDCLQYAKENGQAIQRKAWIKAAKYNYMDILRYLHSIDVERSDISKALPTANLDCLKYLHSIGFNLGEDATACVVDCPTRPICYCSYFKLPCTCFVEPDVPERDENSIKRLECLKFLRERGYPWSRWTVFNASKNGYLECVRYAIENGAPMINKFASYETAASNGHHLILEYLLSINSKDVDVISQCIDHAHPECLRVALKYFEPQSRNLRGSAHVVIKRLRQRENSETHERLRYLRCLDYLRPYV